MKDFMKLEVFNLFESWLKKIMIYNQNIYLSSKNKDVLKNCI